MKTLITITLLGELSSGHVSRNNQIVNNIKKIIGSNEIQRLEWKAGFPVPFKRIEVSQELYVELCDSREFHCVNFTEPGTDIREYFVGFLSDRPVWINNDLEKLQFKFLTKAQIRETKICFLLDEEPNHYIFQFEE